MANETMSNVCFKTGIIDIACPHCKQQRIEQLTRELEEAREQLRLSIIDAAQQMAEANQYRDLFDAACAVLKTPDSTNDMGPGDLAEDIRDVTRELDEALHDAENETAHREACHEEYVEACRQRDEALAAMNADVADVVLAKCVAEADRDRLTRELEAAELAEVERDHLHALLRDIYRRLSAASATEANELETHWNQAIQACLLLMDEAALEE